jgi:hypothetical protein
MEHVYTIYGCHCDTHHASGATTLTGTLGISEKHTHIRPTTDTLSVYYIQYFHTQNVIGAHRGTTTLRSHPPLKRGSLLPLCFGVKEKIVNKDI